MHACTHQSLASPGPSPAVLQPLHPWPLPVRQRLLPPAPPGVTAGQPAARARTPAGRPGPTGGPGQHAQPLGAVSRNARMGVRGHNTGESVRLMVRMQSTRTLGWSGGKAIWWESHRDSCRMHVPLTFLSSPVPVAAAVLRRLAPPPAVPTAPQQTCPALLLLQPAPPPQLPPALAHGQTGRPGQTSTAHHASTGRHGERADLVTRMIVQGQGHTLQALRLHPQQQQRTASPRALPALPVVPP